MDGPATRDMESRRTWPPLRPLGPATTTAPAFGPWPHVRRLGMTDANLRSALGRAGERHARLFLEARDYQFVAANWHCPAGELDLVMRDHAELVFVEVKTRSGVRGGHPSDAVTSVK